MRKAFATGHSPLFKLSNNANNRLYQLLDHMEFVSSLRRSETFYKQPIPPHWMTPRFCPCLLMSGDHSPPIQLKYQPTVFLWLLELLYRVLNRKVFLLSFRLSETLPKQRIPNSSAPALPMLRRSSCWQCQRYLATKHSPRDPIYALRLSYGLYGDTGLRSWRLKRIFLNCAYEGDPGDQDQNHGKELRVIAGRIHLW